MVELLARYRGRGLDRLPDDAMEQLTRCIRRLQRHDLHALIGTAFGEIIGVSLQLAIRYRMHIEKRLRDSDQAGGSPAEIPPDLIDEGWLQRVERIGRFISEISGSHARVQHVGELTARKRSAGQLGKPAFGRPLGNGTSTNGNGQSPPGAGRLGPQATSYQFT